MFKVSKGREADEGSAEISLLLSYPIVLCKSLKPMLHWLFLQSYYDHVFVFFIKCIWTSLSLLHSGVCVGFLLEM